MAQMGNSSSGKSPNPKPRVSVPGAWWEHLEAKFSMTTSVPLTSCPLKQVPEVAGVEDMKNTLEQCISPLLSPVSLITLI